tara:strand:- start:1514 stop:1825 length:312 start_codon:yes stop_codon:yes gene_type:complete
MKGEIQLDSSELASKIVTAVVKELKPLMSDLRQEEEILFTAESLAEYLSVSKQWVYGRVKLNEIPHIKVGKFPRFKRSTIDEWLESQNVPAVSHLTSKLKVIK